MKLNSIKITIFCLLYCILTFVTITTIINYNDFNNHFTVYIQVEQSNNNNENEEEKEDKEEQEEKVCKKEENKNEINFYEKDNNDSCTNADKDIIPKYNYRIQQYPKYIKLLLMDQNINLNITIQMI